MLTGHTGLPSAELLTNLTEMEIGDTFEINVLSEVYTYEVFNIVTVEPSEVDDLERIEDKDIVTLVTCTPYGINSHRLLVQGERIEVEEEDTPVVQAVESDSTNIWETIDYYMPYASLMIIYFLLLIILVLSLLLRNAKKETRALKNITKKDEKKQKKINKLHQKFLKYDKKWQVKNQKLMKKQNGKDAKNEAKSNKAEQKFQKELRKVREQEEQRQMKASRKHRKKK